MHETTSAFDKASFVTAYIGIPIFLALWFGSKFVFRSKMLAPHEVDLFSGKREIDEEEERFNRDQELKGPRTKWQKIWDSL